MNNQFNVIKVIAENLCQESCDCKELQNDLESLERIFSAITGVKAFSSNVPEETDLPFGKVASPVLSANCMLDSLRTKRFVQGVYRAIKEQKNLFKEERLRILYAGSGPYGLLVVLLCFIFESKDFTCTIIDIHKESTDAITKLIQFFKINAYFNKVINCDAFEYHSKEQERPHIIISDMIQEGLQSVPQVALTHHLVPQLVDGGVFIPKEISLNLVHTRGRTDGLSSEKVKGEDKKECLELEEKYLGRVFTLSKDTVKEQLCVNSYPNFKFRALKIWMPEERNLGDVFEIQTEVEVYDNVFLGKNECSLTVPITQTSLSEYDDNTVFEFEYEISDNPKTELRIKRKEFINT